ncbi:MAG: YraN family protein [Vampirovibrionales bacterium]|nr:YraN family protein [Vampirovibrionales bacterium]
MTRKPPFQTFPQSLSTTPRKQLGELGERVAEAHVLLNNFSILARNWRAGSYGEIDIIASRLPERLLFCQNSQEPLLVFIEVKTRLASSRHQGLEDALMAVSAAKQRQIIKLAQRFLHQHPAWQDALIRFDVMAVTWPRDRWQQSDLTLQVPLPSVLWIERAFEGA